MLKKFQVTNFKNFKDPITIDFTKIAGYQFNSECISDHLLGKMMIYGKNSTGKTNLGRALMDIRYILLDYYFPSNDDSFLNADSESRLSKFSYTFSFFGHDINYVYQRNKNRKLHDESLLFDGSKIFYCNFDTHETQFRNLGLLNLQTLNTQLYVEILNSTFDSDESTQVPPFLRWLIANTALPSNSPLLELRNFVARMNLVSTNRIPTFIEERRKFPAVFYDRLSDPKQLKDFQDFLNIMGVPCKLVCKKMPDGKYELYFKHNVLIPFIENASSGTLAIADLYGRLQFGYSCSVLYMDEFDAFYHYEMSKKVVEFIKAKYPQCQVIFTTHNTNLMSNELLRPDCLFILSTQGSLTSLCGATSRELREGHNLEKMYISGEFSHYE